MSTKKVKGRKASIKARDRQRIIGQKLREIYDEAERAPVPQEFLELLDRMQKNEKKKDAES